MLKKENSTGCFPCYHYRFIEPELSCESQPRVSMKHKKEGKQSLKAVSNRSSISNAANITKFQLSPQTDEHNPSDAQQKKKTAVQNQPMNGALVYFYHGMQFTCEVAKKGEECKQIQMQIVDKHGKQNGNATMKKVQKCLSSNPHNICMRQTKKTLISKGSLILGRFRQSVVSVECTNDLPPKFEQSQILIDFFNPASQKKNQLHSYIHSQQ